MVQNTSTSQSKGLALELAKASLVLLKNGDDVLPLSKNVTRIAVVGSAAVAETTPDNMTHLGDYYSGGGSGHVQAAAENLWTALDGIKRWLPEHVELVEAAVDDVAQAVEAASSADVTIVVAGATSGEGVDRADLNLERDADALIAAVASVAKRTVVLLQVPGVVMTPWRGDVDAIAVQFLGGEATGLAWGEMLFGGYSPRGRLPVTFPGHESDEIPPSPAAHVSYSEGQHTGYRDAALLRHAAFPFGHGLSYSRFSVEGAVAVKCDEEESLCVDVKLQNRGRHAASTVAQLYMEGCGMAAPVLKAWARTAELGPQESATVRLSVDAKLLRCWDARKGLWVALQPKEAQIGFSASDLQVKVALASDEALFV
jgi:beta-glucosidase